MVNYKLEYNSFFSMHCIVIVTIRFCLIFLALGGSLEIYGTIPEPVLGRISVAVNIIKTVLKLAFSVAASSETYTAKTPQT